MTPKQQRFVHEYLLDMNATAAAIRAGYSAKTASAIGNENLRKPEISEAIKKALEEKNNALIADRRERQAFWSEIMRDEDSRLADRLKASELLAKSECDFTEKVKAEVAVSGYDFSQYSEEELLQLRALLAKGVKA